MADLVAPITEATVYSDRALVTRRGTITLEAGEHEIRINNLPSFLSDSLRASGRGPQGLRILSVDTTTAFYPRAPEAELTGLQQELEQLEERRKLLQAQRDALNDRRNWLRSLGEQSKDFARGIAQGQMRPQDCADFFSFMANQSSQDAEAALHLDTQIEQANAEVEAKRREINQKQGNRGADRRAALISVELAQGGEVEIELSYIVLEAFWYPQYDVRVQMEADQSHGNVALTYIGMVQQSTGEDWSNVGLSLSTARPSLAATLPELDPWYINVYNPPVIRPHVMNAAMRAAPAGAPPPMAAMSKVQMDAEMDVTPPPMYEAEQATTTTEQTGTALVFRVGRSVDIPSDNSPHKTTIAYDQLPCEFDYATAPALEANAHLRATINNTTERTLLQGETNIFMNSDYVGTTRIKTTAPQEQFKIFLGIDDRIKVKREPIERAVDKGNILQGDIRRSTYAYQIKVHNYATNSRKIIVRDHLPVTQHERIRVRVLTIQPQPTEHTELGLVNWEFSLPADGEKVIEYRFAIENPQNVRVTGLPS
jgi:uncharacterized protein (TIGR02231 family)